MQVVSHPEADEELEFAALWYGERQPGLGGDFLDQFEHTFGAVSWPIRNAGANSEAMIAN